MGGVGFIDGDAPFVRGGHVEVLSVVGREEAVGELVAG